MTKCGCEVLADDVDMTPGGIYVNYVIDYCPLHAAAKRLLQVLKEHQKDHGECSTCTYVINCVESPTGGKTND